MERRIITRTEQLNLRQKVSLFLAGLILAIAASVAFAAPQPRYSSRIVNTSYGQIRGILVQPGSRQMEVVEAFLGVPYASAPTGTRRFKLPQSPSRWSGIRLADKFGAVCPQRFPDLTNQTATLELMPPGRLLQVQRFIPLLTNQSEDCLNLNVYVPGSGSLGEEAPYAVVVWVHGESFEWNSGSVYDGSILASLGRVIVVTLNYRLGVLGFLRTGPGAESAGFLALRDVEAALRWVRTNAAEFGGDPKRVTVLGHHTGASIVNLLLLTPEAKGLVHRAVLLSGSALSPWAVQLDAERAASSIARQVGCEVRRDLTPCLQRVPLARLLQVTLPTPAFLPRIGPPPANIILSGVDPERAMKEKTVGAFVSVPLLIGFTTSESVHEISAYELQWGMEEDRRAQVLRTFVRNAFAWHVTEILAAVLNEYTDWSRAVQHPISLRDNTLEALTDGHTVAPLLRVAYLHSRRGATTYVYHFAYQAKDADYPQRIGSARGDDIAYIMGAPLVSSSTLFPHNFTRQDQAVSHTMLTFLANFAKSGNPNEPQKPSQLEDYSADKEKTRYRSVTWEPFDTSTQMYLSVGPKLRMKSHYRAHRMATWLHLVPQLHQPGGDDVDPRHHHFKDLGMPLYAGEVRPEPYVQRPTRPLGSDDEEEEDDTTGLIECVLVNGSAAVASASTMGQDVLGEDEASELLHRETMNKKSSSLPSFTTALAVTIGAGCLLLLLNILIFAAILYHRERRKSAKHKRAVSELQKESSSSSSGDISVCAMAMTKMSSSPRCTKRPPSELSPSIPEPPPPPSSMPPRSLNPAPKKRVQIQEISV